MKAAAMVITGGSGSRRENECVLCFWERSSGQGGDWGFYWWRYLCPEKAYWAELGRMLLLMWDTESISQAGRQSDQ